MDWNRLGKNLVFAAILLLIVSSIDGADLPLSNRVEEYIAFVLTTDFDFRRWIEETQGLDFLTWDLDFSSWLPWVSTQTAGGTGTPGSEGTVPDDR